jgi:hypothetical protein
MTDITTPSHTLVVRPDRMAMLTEKDRVTDRLDRLERAAAGGLLGGGGGGGLGTEMAMSLGAGSNVSVASAYTKLPAGAVTKQSTDTSGLRYNADGTITILKDGWWQVGGSMQTANITTAAGWVFAIWYTTDDTAPTNPNQFLLYQEAQSGANTNRAESMSLPLWLTANTRFGAAAYNRGTALNCSCQKLVAVRLATGATGAQGAQGPSGAAGPTGAAGDQWFTGTVAPSASAPSGAKIGDYYLNTTNGNYYEKVDVADPGAWLLIGNLKGPQGDLGPPGPQGTQGPAGSAGARWYSGTGAPSSGLGLIGDWYLNDANGDIYEKTGTTAWTLRDNLTGPQGIQGTQGIQGIQGVQGPQGPTGATGQAEGWLSGTGIPGGATGNVGDWYLRTTNSDVYEKTSAGAWTLQTNIKGTAGEKWFSGAYNPNGSFLVAAIGDWFLRTDTGDVYECTDTTGGGVWALRANIKGSQGIQGPTGPSGVAVQAAAPSSSSYQVWVDPDEPDPDPLTAEAVHLLNTAGEPALATNWALYAAGWQAPGFYKDNQSRVFLQGMIKKTIAVVNGEVLFTLPVGYRPLGQSLFVVYSNSAAARIDVMPNGQVVASTGVNAAWVSLAGINFRGEQ